MPIDDPDHVGGVIEVAEYYYAVAEHPVARKVDAFPEQVREVLAGIVNLYLEAVLKRRETQLIVLTRHAFLSEVVSETTLLNEIKRCSGFTLSASRSLWRAMESTLQSRCRRLEAGLHGRQVLFRPLGLLKPLTLRTSTYLLTYRDPAAEQYEQLGLLLTR